MKKMSIILLQTCFISLLVLSILGSVVLPPILQQLTSSRQHTTIIADWTYMVYLDADNNLDSYGIYDLNEMEDGYLNAVSGSVNVIVFIDREYSGAKTYKVVEDHNLGSIASTILTTGFPSEPNMGSKTTLKSFIEYVFNNFPAQKYVLDLWDHGGGIFGICWDDSNGNDKLTFDEVDEALVEVCSAYGETIDILAMDACLMQMLEVHYELNDYVDYIVASEETIPGDGFPYDSIIQRLCNNPSQSAQTYASGMVDDYHNSYSSSYDTTLSAVDVTSSSITNLMNAFNLFVEDLKTLVTTQKSAISSARAATQEFYYDTFVDLKDFAIELRSRVSGQNFKDSCTRLIDNITNAVINYEQHNNPDAFGISIYFPETSSEYDSGYETVIDLGEDTDWDLFLTTYYYGPTYDLSMIAYTYDDAVSINAANDGDGIPEQGETINVSITIKNTGTKDAYSVNGTLFSPNSYVFILVGFQNYGSIAAGSSITLDFQLNISLSAPNGYIVPLTIIINATIDTNFHKNETLILIINQTTTIGGDSFENAQAISEGIFNGMMWGPDPTDGSAWFKISVPAGKYLIVSIITGDPGTDFDIYIYTESGQFLTAAIKSTYPDTCSTYAHETGEYRIRIYPYDGSGSFTFNVTISNTTGPEDGLSIGTAISLSSTHPSASGYLPAATPEGEMYFRIFLEQGQHIIILLRGDESQNDFDISLYDYLLDELAWSWSVSYPERIEWTATYTGYHYLIVLVWSGNGDFVIEVAFVGGAPPPIPFAGWSIAISLAFLISLGFFRRRKYSK
ncbi:MAG: clostripain-related cysteine peptidase [Candidatus Helarchaeota archaeon]